MMSFTEPSGKVFSVSAESPARITDVAFGSNFSEVSALPKSGRFTVRLFLLISSPSQFLVATFRRPLNILCLFWIFGLRFAQVAHRACGQCTPCAAQARGLLPIGQPNIFALPSLPC